MIDWSVWGKEKLITGETISCFADVTDNHQWVHEDSVRVLTESPYGRQIAHGLLLVALIPSLLPDDGELPPHKLRIIRSIEKLRLPSPVYPGDTIRARVRRLSEYAAQSGKGTVIVCEVEVWSLTGIKPAVSCVLSLQYF